MGVTMLGVDQLWLQGMKHNLNVISSLLRGACVLILNCLANANLERSLFDCLKAFLSLFTGIYDFSAPPVSWVVCWMYLDWGMHLLDISWIMVVKFVLNVSSVDVCFVHVIAELFVKKSVFLCLRIWYLGILYCVKCCFDLAMVAAPCVMTNIPG